ncbi:MAG: adenylate/guanylate cyclase domain-containing protein [Saprospiraceae bacterium]
MKQCILFILSLFFIIHNTELKTQDSLQHLLNTDIHDTTRIDVLDQLSQLYRGIDLDTCIAYAQEAILLAGEINDMERQAYMQKNAGIGYYYKGDFVKVLEYWESSLTTFENINHLTGISNLQSNIGAVYNSTGDYPQAIDYHLKSLRIAEKNGDDFRKATALQNIGAVYSNMEDYEESAKYYNQALELCESINYEGCIGIVTMNLSEVFRHQGQFDKAALQIEKAKKLFTKLNNPSLPEAIIASADLSNMRKNFAQGIKESNEALQLAKAADSKQFIHRALITRGQGYNGLNKSKLAIQSFKQALEEGKGLGVGIDVQENYKGLKDALVQSGQYKKALEAQDSLISINKQLYDIDKNANISNLQLEFSLEKRDNEIALLNADNALKNQLIQKAKIQRRFLIATSIFFFLMIGGIGYLYQFSQKKNKIISDEKNKSDGLLKNILPPETAEELKRNGIVKPKRFEFTTVLFTDFVGFTQVSSHHSPETIVSSIDYYFKEFDKIVAKNNLEKIKTIGDAYMCAGGLHLNDKDHSKTTFNTVNAAKDMLDFTVETADNPPDGIVPFQVRIGINSGPVVAGVVGQTKFQYDIWGDTVNVASRMETHSEPNKVNVSENVYNILKSDREFVYRGEVNVKNKGKMKMYYLEEFSKN